MESKETIHTINSVRSIEEYTEGDLEKIAVASSAFVNGAVGLCTVSKSSTNEKIQDKLKTEIANNLTPEKSELATQLYNGFYNEDKRKVL